MALCAGRDVAPCIAARRQQLALLQRGRIGCRRPRQPVRQIDGGKILRDLQQVSVRQRVHQAGHQAVVAAAVAEVEQLVVQVARWLAREARVKAVGAGAAFLAVTGAAGQRALRHAVFEYGDRREGAGCGRQQQGRENASHDAADDAIA
jgi:hypothetical protein